VNLKFTGQNETVQGREPQQGVTAIAIFRLAAFRIHALSKIEQIELMRCNT